MSFGVLIIAAAIVAAIYYYKMYHPNTYMPPYPNSLRKNISYGYYLSTEDTIDEIKDHVNFIFESNWDQPSGVIKRLQKHNHPIVLAITKECYGSFTDTRISPYIRYNLSALFDALKEQNLLHRVYALYPVDEPDGKHIAHGDMMSVINIIKDVCLSYPELKDVKLAVVYSTHNTYPGFEGFDIVGIDKYGVGSNVFISNEYKELYSRLLPHQGIVIVPGGAEPWEQDPEAFERYAHNNSRVVAIMPFLWIDYTEGSPSVTYKGIRNNKVRQKYIDLGLRLKALRES